jgi:hypothetical protein
METSPYADPERSWSTSIVELADGRLAIPVPPGLLRKVGAKAGDQVVIERERVWYTIRVLDEQGRCRG